MASYPRISASNSILGQIFQRDALRSRCWNLPKASCTRLELGLLDRQALGFSAGFSKLPQSRWLRGSVGAALAPRILHPLRLTSWMEGTGGTPGLWVRNFHLNITLEICLQGWHLQHIKHSLPLEKNNQWASIIYIQIVPNSLCSFMSMLIVTEQLKPRTH